MKFKQLIKVTLIFWSAFSMTSFANPQEEAIRFVQKMELGSNLNFMAFQVGKSTQTFRMMVLQMGESVANKRFNEELIKVLPHYQREWDKNMALAYLEFFPTKELKSILDEKEKSPYFSKLRVKQIEIGDSMQSHSKHILSELITETLTNSLKAMTNN